MRLFRFSLIPLLQKTAVGICTPEFRRTSATFAIQAFFSCLLQWRAVRGIRKGGRFPDSGSANLVQSATISCFAPVSGGFPSNIRNPYHV